jgi:hypothetical protein
MSFWDMLSGGVGNFDGSFTSPNAWAQQAGAGQLGSLTQMLAGGGQQGGGQGMGNLMNMFNQGGSGFGATTQQFLTPNKWGNQMGSAWQDPDKQPSPVAAPWQDPDKQSPVPQMQSPAPMGSQQAGIDPMTTQPVQNPAQGLMTPQFLALAEKQKEDNAPETLGQVPQAVGNPYQGGQTRTSRMEMPRARGGRESNLAGLLGGYFG